MAYDSVRDWSALARRWGVGRDRRVWVGGHNASIKRRVEELLQGAKRPPRGPVELALITPRSVDEAVYFAAKLLTRLEPAGVVWVVYATEPAGGQSEGALTFETLEGALRDVGLVEVETASVADNVMASCFRPAG